MTTQVKSFASTQFLNSVKFEKKPLPTTLPVKENIENNELSLESKFEKSVEPKTTKIELEVENKLNESINKKITPVSNQKSEKFPLLLNGIRNIKQENSFLNKEPILNSQVNEKDKEVLNVNKEPAKLSENKVDKLSYANMEDQQAIINKFRGNPNSEEKTDFSKKIKESVKSLDSVFLSSKKEAVYSKVEKDFKLAILSIPPNSKTIENLSMLSKEELKELMLPLMIDTKSKYSNYTKISDLPQNKQKLLDSIVNGIHDAFPNKANGSVNISGKDAHKMPIKIDVPQTIKLKGIEYKNPIHLASGGLGHALKYTDDNGKSVIVKQLKFDQKDSQELKLEKRNEMITEYKAHREAQGTGEKNIVGLKGMVIGENDSLYIVMDEAKGGEMENLLDKIKDNNNISETTKELIHKSLLKDTMSGISKLHEKDIKHLDLKSENIFLNEDGTGVVGDFGKSRSDNFESEFFSTTPHIRSPEMLSKDKIVSKESDIWAVGLMAFRMFEGSMDRFLDKNNSGKASWAELENFSNNAENRVYTTGDTFKNEFEPKINLLKSKKEEAEKNIEVFEKKFESVLQKYNEFPIETRKKDISNLIYEANKLDQDLSYEVEKASNNGGTPSKDLIEKANNAKKRNEEVKERFKDYSDAQVDLTNAKNLPKDTQRYIDKLTSRLNELETLAKKDKLETKHEIVNALMHPDPTKRPDLKDVLKHSFFQDQRLESNDFKDLMKELVKKPELQDQEKIKMLSNKIDNL